METFFFLLHDFSKQKINSLQKRDRTFEFFEMGENNKKILSLVECPGQSVSSPLPGVLVLGQQIWSCARGGSGHPGSLGLVTPQ